MKVRTGTVLIRRDPTPETRGSSMIVVPDAYRWPKATGVVVETGSAEVQVGERVLHSAFSGHEFKLNDWPHVLCGVRDLIAIVPEGTSLD